MGNIVLLDELTINKIAAGEVIERPASVIKEMVENSIDAGAKNITVEIKNGGISFIRITDNGKGIAKDDVEMAFERHATSKIRSADDLNEVKSMGFRGEALASIAAISYVELVSRTEDEEIGTRILVEGGNILGIDEVGASKGTTITVRNLFFNTPVRYKFLKKDFTESGYIEDVITRISLIHPEVAIKLINTGKTVIQTNGNGDLKSVIYNIFGKDVANNVMNVEYEYEYIKIKGVVGGKQIARSNRSNQMFFVNKRYIKDKTLSSAVEQAFKGLLPFGKFPFLVLNLEMPASKVDVNVHPAKLEVRFEEENIIFKSMYHAIKDTLSNIDMTKEENENILKENKEEIFNTTPINDIKKEESDVTKKLKMLQEELKQEVESNPKIQLTDEYKEMEHKYNEKAEIPLQQNESEKTIKKEEMELPKAIREMKENFIPILFKDSNVNKETELVKEKKEEESEQNNQFEEEKPIKDIKNEKVEESVENTKNEIVEEETKNENIGESAENKKNEKVEESIEQANDGKVEKSIEYINNDKLEEQTTKEEKELSFNEMYKKLFGKEPYGGRKVEEVDNDKKQKKDNYYTLDSKIEDDNLSLFEEEENVKTQYKIIGTAFDTYIILQIENELYIMDKKSAKERIIYEKLKINFYDEKEKSSQLLLLPDIINLTYKEMDIAKDNLALFRRAGFILEEFGENTIKLSGVPEICIDLNTEELFKETLEEINTVARNAIQEREEKFLATIAYKAACKANSETNREEINNLIDELFELQNPFISAFGKPIVIKMTKYEIERKFARK